MQIIILEKSRLFHLGYLFGGMLTLYICSRGAEGVAQPMERRLPSLLARVEGNYGQTVGQQTDET